MTVFPFREARFHDAETKKRENSFPPELSRAWAQQCREALGNGYKWVALGQTRLGSKTNS